MTTVWINLTLATNLRRLGEGCRWGVLLPDNRFFVCPMPGQAQELAASLGGQVVWDVDEDVLYEWAMRCIRMVCGK
jgi:hypothetical protein